MEINICYNHGRVNMTLMNLYMSTVFSFSKSEYGIPVPKNQGPAREPKILTQQSY